MMIISNILGIILFLFLLWKRLKEDYSYEKIFNFAVLILTGLLIGFLVSKKILPSYWFFIEIIGIAIGFTIGVIKLKFKFIEAFDGVVIGLLPWVTLFFLSDSIKNSALSSFLAFWVSLTCIFLFFLTESHYRRVGFSAVFIAGLFFLIRALISLFSLEAISFSGNLESYISGTVAFGFFLLLYKLSRNKK